MTLPDFRLLCSFCFCWVCNAFASVGRPIEQPASVQQLLVMVTLGENLMGRGKQRNRSNESIADAHAVMVPSYTIGLRQLGRSADGAAHAYVSLSLAKKNLSNIDYVSTFTSLHNVDLQVIAHTRNINHPLHYAYVHVEC